MVAPRELPVRPLERIAICIYRNAEYGVVVVGCVYCHAKNNPYLASCFHSASILEAHDLVNSFSKVLSLEFVGENLYFVYYLQ